jgi:hypothetical protein
VRSNFDSLPVYHLLPGGSGQYVRPIHPADGVDKWVSCGCLIIDSGEFTHDQFPIDPQFLMAVTEYVASNDLEGIVRLEVNLVRQQSRLKVIIVDNLKVAA